MFEKADKNIYLKAAKCLESLNAAIQLFKEYLDENSPSNSPAYYRARNYLREGETFFQETIKESKKLLGPLPEYASSEYEKWREEFLEQHKVLAVSHEYGELQEELFSDEHLSKWMCREEVETYLNRSYESQKSGKRKLANIKVRIILDKLSELLEKAQEQKKKAMAKLQNYG